MVDILTQPASSPRISSPTGESVHERRARRFFQRWQPLIWCMAGLVLLLQIRSWWTTTPDAVQYLSIARSIAHGNGPLRFGSPLLVYQPGYALLLVPVFCLADNPFLLLSILQVGLGALALYLAWRWARPYVGTGAVALVALICADVAFLEGCRRFLSEIAGMTLLLTAGLLLRKASSTDVRGWRLAGWTAAGVLALISACLVRYVSFALVPGMVLVAGVRLYKRRPGVGRMLGLAILCGLPALATILTSITIDQHHAQGKHTNVSYLMETPHGLAYRLIDTLRLRLCATGQLTIPGMERVSGGPGEWLNPAMALYVPLFALIVWGWWRLLRQRGDVLIAAMPFYFAVYLAWPDDANSRFFLPILPLIWLCAWRGIALIRRWRYVIASSLILVHLGVAIGAQIREAHVGREQWNRYWVALQHLTPQLLPYRDRVAVRDVGREAHWWLAYDLDRVVYEDKGNRPIPGTIEILVLPAKAPVPDGFADFLAEPNLRIVKRVASRPTTQP